MILLKSCEIYAPQPMGKKDVLVGGGKVLAIENEITLPSSLEVETVQGNGLMMIPGLVDSHVHIAGAGGEGGPATRTPEMNLSQMLAGGITTVVGCLGTDGFTRSLQSVLMKAKSLRAEGVSAWMYTGSYQVPTPTLLGDVGKDVALIDEVIGVGEIAISDHRSSFPSVEELIRLAEHARVGGMLGGKAGIVNVHMGDAQNPFQPIHDAVTKSELKFSQFLPTHCNRNHHIFEEAKTYGKDGFVDLTGCGYYYFPDVEIKPSSAVVALLEAGVPLEHITISSDGCGSLPLFDKSGKLVKMDSGEPKAMFDELVDLVLEEKQPLEQAVTVVTENVAHRLKLPHKGRIGVGQDADLVLLDNRFQIRHVVAMGCIMVKDGWVIKQGTFEKEKLCLNK